MISVNDLKYTTVFIADNTEEPRHSFTGFILNLSWLKPRDSWELISTEKIFTKLSR